MLASSWNDDATISQRLQPRKEVVIIFSILHIPSLTIDYISSWWVALFQLPMTTNFSNNRLIQHESTTAGDSFMIFIDVMVVGSQRRAAVNQSMS